MANDVIADFLVRLGFDGKEVVKGVAKTEAALKRLKKAKIDSVKTPKDVQLDQAVKATKQRISAEQNLNRMKTANAKEEIRTVAQQKKAELDKNREFLRAAKTRLKEHKRMISIDKQLTGEQARRAREAAVQRRKEQAHLKRLLKKKAQLRRLDAFNVAGVLDPGVKKDLRGQISRASNVAQLEEINAQIRREVKSRREVTQQMNRQLTLQNAMKFGLRGMVDSLKNFARSWMSVFAVIGGSLAGLRFTQQFQALEASMSAVSENSKSAAENVEFIKELSRTLPVDVQKAGDNFKNMLASGREALGQQGVQELFTAVTEFGTALQVDPERMNRGLQAISQMLNYFIVPSYRKVCRKSLELLGSLTA